MSRRVWLAASVGGAALAIGIAAVVSPAIVGDRLRQNLASSVQGATCPSVASLEANGGVIPVKLPKREMAPRRPSSCRGSDLRRDAAQPPPLREVAIEFDRHGALDATGLPVCNPNIESQKISQAESICKGSIVGEGTATFEIAAPESSPHARSAASLVIINGGFRDGVRILYAEAFVTVQTPFVHGEHARSQEDPRWPLIGWRW